MYFPTPSYSLFFVCATLIYQVKTSPVHNHGHGFLNSSCNGDQDCRIVENLQLACWSNVNKCRCQNVQQSDFHLLWHNGKCRSSKYGPCGKNGSLEVDCLDGFVCMENQCRDPAVTRNPAITSAYKFQQTCEAGCGFSDELTLDCDHDSGRCVCRELHLADGASSDFHVHTYRGNQNCSVGKSGPCGRMGKIEIGCHDVGTSCTNGICTDSQSVPGVQVNLAITTMPGPSSPTTTTLSGGLSTGQKPMTTTTKIVNQESGLCLISNPSGNELGSAPCKAQDPRQLWKLEVITDGMNGQGLKPPTRDFESTYSPGNFHPELEDPRFENNTYPGNGARLGIDLQKEMHEREHGEQTEESHNMEIHLENRDNLEEETHYGVEQDPLHYYGEN